MSDYRAKIQQRRDSRDKWESSGARLAAGEIGVCLDTGEMRLGMTDSHGGRYGNTPRSSRPMVLRVFASSAAITLALVLETGRCGSTPTAWAPMCTTAGPAKGTGSRSPCHW